MCGGTRVGEDGGEWSVDEAVEEEGESMRMRVSMRMRMMRRGRRRKLGLGDRIVGPTQEAAGKMTANAADDAAFPTILAFSPSGKTFAHGQFSPDMHPETHAYTVLESTTSFT